MSKDSQTKQVEQPAKNEPTPGDEKNDNLIQRFSDLVVLPEVKAWNLYRNEVQYKWDEKTEKGFRLCYAAGKAVGEYGLTHPSIPTPVKGDAPIDKHYVEIAIDALKAETQPAAAPKGDDVISRYEKYIANIQWHIDTNKPTGAALSDCEKGIKLYSEFLQDLKLAFKSAPQAVKWVQAEEIIDFILQLSDEKKLDLVDGQFYHDWDKDGDFPLEAKEIIKLFKDKLEGSTDKNQTK